MTDPWANFFACLVLRPSGLHDLKWPPDIMWYCISVVIIMWWAQLELGWEDGSVCSHGPKRNSNRVSPIPSLLPRLLWDFEPSTTVRCRNYTSKKFHQGQHPMKIKSMKFFTMRIIIEVIWSARIEYNNYLQSSPINNFHRIRPPTKIYSR